jgi:DNA-binding NarL/FixJ family response regulator
MNDLSHAKIASVMIAEDDPVMRQHFEEAVRVHPRLSLAGSVGTCREAVAMLTDPPDVLLVDLGLPDGDGCSLIKLLKSKTPEAEALVVTVFAEESRVVDAIRAGASGYILKDMINTDIGKTIMEVLGGGSPISPSIARYILKALVAPDIEKNDNAHQPGIALSDREKEVLHLIARGYKREEISSLLKLSIHTVVTHIRHIYKKLKVHNQNEAVYEACQLGLIDINA